MFQSCNNSFEFESMKLLGIHHAAIICSDYAKFKSFYCDVLGLKVLAEHYRQERNSYKLDLQLPDGSQIELFASQSEWPRSAGVTSFGFSCSFC